MPSLLIWDSMPMHRLRWPLSEAALHICMPTWSRERVRSQRAKDICVVDYIINHPNAPGGKLVRLDCIPPLQHS